ncbi:GNAT family N-acetyltransferase [Allobaculum sp. Allo2]|nr:GNAT family N-acetyltransferase [Allobaculum sp. Allo2]UNT94079.1 GNAT family N-acetyltransferase [Allobaculum sp. Allo2]
MEIRTERLTLRTWQADDAAALYALASEPEIGEKCGWVPHSSAEYSAMVIDSSLQNDEAYAIVLSENNTIIGSVSIKLDGDSDLSNWEDEGEIGVWIGKPYWKKATPQKPVPLFSITLFTIWIFPKSGPAITMGTWLRENCSRVLALSRKEPKKNI